MTMHNRVFGRLLLSCAILLSCAAAAQERYPSKPLRLIVSSAAGSTADLVAHIYADKLAAKLEQPVTVLNLPGAGGAIGASTAATASPDGYTLALANSNHTIQAAVNKNITYDPVADFAPIAFVGETPTVVVVNASLGITNLRDFVKYAQANPNAINYATGGIGSVNHLAGAYFAHQTGTQMKQIGYRQAADGMADLVAGRVQAIFTPISFVLPYVRQGKLLALAVSTPEPMRDPVEVPSVRSFNVDYDISGWYGFLAPAKTPAAIVDRLHVALDQISQEPEVREKLRVQAIVPRAMAPREFGDVLRKEVDRLKPLVRSMGETIKN